MTNSNIPYYLINSITMYRLVSAPFLLLLVYTGEVLAFKWLVALSFFTDAVDGPLARRFNVISVFGSRLDSVADDATILVSTLGLWIISPEFVHSEWLLFVGLFFLFGIQTVAALIAYKKVTSFHTYMAKVAAVSQGLFFISFFFGLGPSYLLFMMAVTVTAIQLIEEIILVIMLPEWKANVRGIYWELNLSKLTSQTKN
ncbi:CDP-alcohol phosphatidyltransferase family protein [Chryseotalea sanaruensis]|uniref:CDP-alcohol phosphatidyltransferase family protein n=1 Tax=Chryseotalea sanaruensis TaxID=2482724 RepID=A0A401U662_9BACT|nr:CDP-alcohol phosphatidyltransferase family protein [Chryseotalea sanaruensis]GCC50403.1 CDP-alcohol phosphatidyltransferase family protein [Chryseotalea sanaruensis]